MAEAPLITSWTEYAAAGHQLIARATRSLLIFDRDLQSLRLEAPDQIAGLTRFLRASPTSVLRIALHTAEPLREKHPRLLELLRLFAHKLHVVEIPVHLANLQDSIVVADESSALIRFHHDHARSKLIEDDPEAVRPYAKRFEEIWAEGGTPVSATTIGL